MGQAYWITEYCRVFLAYGFVMYLWPAVVFENHLRGRSMTYRFGFCVTASVLIVNAGVLLLGLVHALRPWVSGLLYFGVFFWRLFTNHRPRALWEDLRRLLAGAMTAKRFFVRLWDRAAAALRGWLGSLWKRTAGRRVELALLMAALVFGTLYFSYAAFDEHCYGCGDQYVHHSWIYGLKQGKAFSSGIYPEAMHCVIYLTCTLFGIRLYSGVLFFAGVQVHTLLISAYLFMRQVFRWRGTPLVVLAMYLTFDQLSVIAAYSMSRLAWTLPMEFGLDMAFLSGAFLLRFLRRVRRGNRVKLRPFKPKEWGVVHDEDLFLFSAAVGASLAIHFYSTIVAFFFCLAVALVYLRQALRRGSLLPLAASVLLGFGAAVAPMGIAFAAGYPLQGSLYWAMGLIEDSAESGREEASEDGGEAEVTSETEPSETPSASDPADTAGESPDAAVSEDRPAAENTRTPITPEGLRALVKSKALTLCSAGYNALYPGIRSTAILAATAFGAASALILHLVFAVRAALYRRRSDGEPQPDDSDMFDGVLITALLSVMLMTVNTAGALGLPVLVESSRLYSTEQVLFLMLYCVPLDYLLALLKRLLGEALPKFLTAAAFVGAYVFTQAAGMFHNSLCFQFTRYNAAVEMTNRIIDTLPEETYTIISTTDELYQLIEFGYHEELLTFAENEADPSYSIPTKYLFLYIEKHPLRYAHYHFVQGPKWLFREDYAPFYQSMGSLCPDVLAGEISEESAGEDIIYGEKPSDSASSLPGRIVLESKAYAWYQKFSEIHPRDCRVIYEDDDFICCCITQNPAYLYSLGVMGPD